MLRLIIFALLLVALSPAHAAIYCGKTGFPVGGHIGIPDPASNLSLVQIAWLPYEEEMRYRYQEVIDIDWQEQSISQVYRYDGALTGIVENDIREAELLSSSNFSTGHLDLVFCMPPDHESSRGLIFAHYGEDRSKLPLVVPFRWQRVDGGLWFSAVVNKAISSSIVNSFNFGIVQNVTDDVERATGIRPPRYLAESLIQQNLIPATDLVFRDQALLFGGHNALVIGNQIIITGDNASLTAVHSVNDVYSNDNSIMDSNYLLTDLEKFIGPISIEAHGVRRPAIIVDGRADFEATVSDCVNGFSNVSAHMTYASELTGGITLENSSLRSVVVSDHQSINAEISCDTAYKLESSRKIFKNASQSRLVNVGESTAFINFSNPDRYSIYMIYVLQNPPWLAFPTGPYNIDVDLIEKIWGIADLETLRGKTNYYCDPPGDEVVDSIDEIVTNAFARLTSNELEMLQMEGYLFDDSDGDGSICNSGELNDDPSRYVRQIELSVTPNLAPIQ